MSNIKLILSLVLIWGSSVCYAQNNDKKSVESQVDRMVSDWNTHEFKNMDSYATEDVEWVNIVGMWWKGREDVKKAHQFTFDKFFKGVPFTKKSLTIRLLTGDVAIANWVCHVGALFPPDGIDRGNNRTPETDNLLTLVYVKKKGNWLLSAGQNTVIDAKAAPHNPIANK
jgi:uncharacterized protein (TIGR02246 family)